jgi:hypothetical protein
MVCSDVACIWPIDLLSAAKERKPRDVTPDERERFEIEAPVKP